jgi:hypothetical protein
MGFLLTFGGQETWHPTFADAARDLGLVSERSGNVFDAAYRSEIDAHLTYDTDAFIVELEDGQAVRVGSFDEAQHWLDAAIRRSFPRSAYAAEP